MCAFRAHINQTLFKNINNITKIILQNGSYITRQLRVSSLLWFKVTRSRVRVLRLVIYTSCYTNTNSVKKKTFIPVYLRFEVWETTSLLHTTQRERERTEERYKIREGRSWPISQVDWTRLQWIGPRGGDANGLGLLSSFASEEGDRIVYGQDSFRCPTRPHEKHNLLIPS